MLSSLDEVHSPGSGEAGNCLDGKLFCGVHSPGSGEAGSYLDGELICGGSSPNISCGISKMVGPKKQDVCNVVTSNISSIVEQSNPNEILET